MFQNYETKKWVEGHRVKSFNTRDIINIIIIIIIKIAYELIILILTYEGVNN